MQGKICRSFDEAIADISDKATIMMHSFGGPAGVCQNLIEALQNKGVKDLTVISCNFAPGIALIPSNKSMGPITPQIITPAALVENKQVSKVVTGWVGASWQYGIESPLEKAVRAGEVEVELLSQGVLAARIRAGGSGIGPFYSPVGVDTILEQGKEKRVIDGKEYLLEKPLRADFGFVRAFKADEFGNLVYRKTARSYNPLIAMAVDIAIVEVEEIVEAGELDPESIITPGIVIDRIVKIPQGGRGTQEWAKRLIRETLGKTGETENEK